MNCICAEPIGHRDAPQDVEWRRVEDFPGYWVSEAGHVWGPRGMLSAHVGAYGKARVSMYIGFPERERKVRMGDVHRLVARAFLPGWGPRRRLRFKDGNPWNCALDNLEWAPIKTRTPQPSCVPNDARAAKYAALKSSGLSAAQAGRVAGVSRNAILGVLWRRAQREKRASASLVPSQQPHAS